MRNMEFIVVVPEEYAERVPASASTTLYGTLDAIVEALKTAEIPARVYPK